MITENWSALVRFVEWQPGNATRYSLIITPVNGEAASRSTGFSTYNGFLISWVNAQGIPSMLVPSYIRPNAQYVAEKMGINEADAEEIVKVIHEILAS